MNTTTASTQFNPKYQVNAPKMTDSELREYYRENDIFISSNETGSVTNVLKNSSRCNGSLTSQISKLHLE